MRNQSRNEVRTRSYLPLGTGNMQKKSSMKADKNIAKNLSTKILTRFSPENLSVSIETSW